MHPTFIPLSPLPQTPRVHRKPRIALCAASPHPPLSRLARAAALATLLASPLAAHARPKNTITMTDQVPNFTLPSQTARRENGMLKTVIRVGKRVVPVVGVLAVAIWAVRKVVRRAEERQLRDFQTQLQSLSSMLDLDGEKKTGGGDGDVRESAKEARRMLDGAKRYKFRKEGVEKGEEDLAGKVELELFKGRGGFEGVVLECLKDIEGGKDVREKLERGRSELGVGEGEGKRVWGEVVSKTVSGILDEAGRWLEVDDRKCLKELNRLVVVLGGVRGVWDGVELKYVGKLEEGDRVREELYRRYGVFCLSNEGGGEMEGLGEMQRLLGISDERAEEVNKELAKGMFQVAVSAAMADGSLDEDGRKALEELKTSFGEFLEGGSADEIMSEVAVMRAMYSLQQLLQEQGVSEEDVRELRKMCGELGVDLDDMLSNADALGDALGPEAKQFVENLRRLLSNEGGVVTTTGKPVEDQT